MADFPDQWPVTSFHFSVTIAGEQISFQEVSGLDQEADTLEYRHGDSEIFSTIKRAGLVKTSPIVLKKAVFDSDDRLLEMFNRIYDKDFYDDPDSRMDLLIELLDETGDAIMSWNVLNAIPVKLTAPNMKSDSSQIAIESIEFVHEGISVEIE